MKNRGLTLLEIALSMSLITTVMVAVFWMHQGQQRVFWSLLGAIRGPLQASEALSFMEKELVNATGSLTVATSSIQYKALDGTNREFYLEASNASDPRSRALIFKNGAQLVRILDGRALQNHNPSRVLLVGADGATTSSWVSLATLNPAPIPRIVLYFVIQTGPDEPVQYLRTSVTQRNR